MSETSRYFKYRSVIRALTVVSVILLAVSLFPVLYLSFTDVAAGDDYGYGTCTHIAWQETHSILKVIAAAAGQVVNSYYGWQGTWFSVFMFTLQPESFLDGTYWMVPWIVIGMQMVSVMLFLHHFMVKKLDFENNIWLIVSSCVMILLVQCVSSPQCAIYWYVGTVHYMLPFAMALVAIVCADCFIDTGKWRFWLIVLVLQTLLGGASYQAAILTPLVIGIIIFLRFIFSMEKSNQKASDRQILTVRSVRLMIPFALEIIGLVISAVAPGNKKRAGSDFGFSIGRVLTTILKSFEEYFAQLKGLITENAIVVIMILIITLVCLRGAGYSIAGFRTGNMKKMFGHPILFVLLMICLNAASHAPSVYAAVDVSGGVGNTNFYVAILTGIAIIIYLTEFWAQNTGHIISMKLAVNRASVMKKAVIALLLILTAGLCITGRHALKKTTDYVCIQYIASGQAEDYRNQMELQKIILKNSDDTDPVVPFINNEQGPLQQMPVTSDSKAWSNQVTASFYGKNSVKAIDRSEWEKKYKVE